MSSILLLHGALGSSKDLLSLTYSLESAGFVCFSFDFTGHGSNKGKGDFSILEMVQEVENFIAHHHLQGCSVFGYSLGGYIALKLAESNHHCFSHVITLATKLNWTENCAALEAAKCDEEFIRTKAPELYLKLSAQHKELKNLIPLTKKLLLNMPNTKAIASATILCPVLLLRGDADKLVTEQETRSFQENLREGSFRTLPNIKHSLESADPLLLAQLISDFVKT